MSVRAAIARKSLLHLPPHGSPQGAIALQNNLPKGMDPGYVAKRIPDSARPIMVDYRNAVAIRHKALLNEEETELFGAVKALAWAGKMAEFSAYKAQASQTWALAKSKTD